MGLGELLDSIFSLYRRNFLLIVAIAAVLEVPAAILSLPLTASGVASINDASARIKVANGALSSTDVTAVGQDALRGFGLLLAVGVVQFLIIQPLVQAAMTRAVSDRYLERDATVGAAYRAALRRFRPLVALSLWLMLLLGGISFVTLFVIFLIGNVAVGIILGLAWLVLLIHLFIRFSFAAPAIVIEGASGLGGMRRSGQLVRGSWWRVFGIELIFVLVASILGGIVTGLISLPGAALGTVGALVLNQVASAVTRVLLAPITLIGVILLYYDMRIRKEAFDLEMLARSL